MIRAEDRDEDGIRIPRDPFDFAEGAFVNSAGVEVAVEIYSLPPRGPTRWATPESRSVPIGWPGLSP